MTALINDIDKAVAYEVITAMGDDELDALLTADDLLASMAVPVTQFDFTYSNRGKLKKLMVAVEGFIKKSRLSVNSYTKAGLMAKFERLWLPTLTDGQKQELIAEYRLVDGFNEEGYALFNAKNYQAWKRIFDNGQIPRFKYKVPQFWKGSSSVELIDDRPFTTYQQENVDGYKEVMLNITEEEWYQIVKGASASIKRMLQCYLQAGRGQRYNLSQLEEMYGIKGTMLCGSVVALGRRAQRMLNFAVVNKDNPEGRHYWSTPTTKARLEDGLWVWELRPELMNAAERVLNEEHFPKIERV